MKDSVFQKRFERKQQNHQVHGQRLTVFYRQMDSDFPLSSLVKLMLRRCENSVSPSLYRQMADSLVGFRSQCSAFSTGQPRRAASRQPTERFSPIR